MSVNGVVDKRQVACTSSVRCGHPYSVVVGERAVKTSSILDHDQLVGMLDHGRL